MVNYSPVPTTKPWRGYKVCETILKPARGRWPKQFQVPRSDFDQMNLVRIYGVLSLVPTGVTVGLAIVLFILFTSIPAAMDLRFGHASRCVRGTPHNTRGPGPSRKTQESSPIVYDVDVMTVGGGSTKSHGRVAERAGRQAGADAVGVEASDFSLLIGGEDAPIRAEGEVVHLKVCVNFRRAGSAVGQNRHAQNRSCAGDGNVSGSAKELDAIGANGQSSGRRD